MFIFQIVYLYTSSSFVLIFLLEVKYNPNKYHHQRKPLAHETSSYISLVHARRNIGFVIIYILVELKHI